MDTNGYDATAQLHINSKARFKGLVPLSSYMNTIILHSYIHNI